MIVGKSATPEFGIPPVTEPRRFGPTRNPWDPERTPAARAAAPVRPWRPERCRWRTEATAAGRSASRPRAAASWASSPRATASRTRRTSASTSSSTDGALTRTVADSAALLDVMAGYEPGDANWAPPPAEPFAAMAAREPGKLRIGLTARHADRGRARPGLRQARADRRRRAARRRSGTRCARCRPRGRASSCFDPSRCCGPEASRSPWPTGSSSAATRPRRTTSSRSPGRSTSRASGTPSVEYIGAVAMLQGVRARGRLHVERPRRARHARACQPSRSGSARSTRAREDPMEEFMKAARFTPVHRGHQRDGSARDLRAALPRRRRSSAGGAAGRASGRRGGAARRWATSSSRHARGRIACRPNRRPERFSAGTVTSCERSPPHCSSAPWPSAPAPPTPARRTCQPELRARRQDHGAAAAGRRRSRPRLQLPRQRARGSAISCARSGWAQRCPTAPAGGARCSTSPSSPTSSWRTRSRPARVEFAGHHGGPAALHGLRGRSAPAGGARGPGRRGQRPPGQPLPAEPGARRRGAGGRAMAFSIFTGDLADSQQLNEVRGVLYPARRRHAQPQQRRDEPGLSARARPARTRPRATRASRTRTTTSRAPTSTTRTRRAGASPAGRAGPG